MSERYLFRWKNNPRRAELFGRCCRILERGSQNTVLVEFENGERVTTSGRALKRVPTNEASPPRGRAVVWTVYLMSLDNSEGRAWKLGRVMGSTEEVALRAARKRWIRYAEHPGLRVRAPDQPWPLHLLERRALPRS